VINTRQSDDLEVDSDATLKLDALDESQLAALDFRIESDRIEGTPAADLPTLLRALTPPAPRWEGPGPWVIGPYLAPPSTPVERMYVANQPNRRADFKPMLRKAILGLLHGLIERISAFGRAHLQYRRPIRLALWVALPSRLSRAASRASVRIKTFFAHRSLSAPIPSSRQRN
jgi:hypothetical protein